jgi:hypothetical protein
MEEKEELSVSLSKYAKDDEHARLLTSKRALTAFHEKCLDLVKDKQSGYLNTDDFTELLGGASNATPAFLKDLLNKMVANVSLPTGPIHTDSARILFNFMSIRKEDQCSKSSRRTRA